MTDNSLKVKRFCLRCLSLKLRRNHALAICENCAETIAQFFTNAYGYSPVKDAEGLINGTTPPEVS